MRPYAISVCASVHVYPVMENRVPCKLILQVDPWRKFFCWRSRGMTDMKWKWIPTSMKCQNHNHYIKVLALAIAFPSWSPEGTLIFSTFSAAAINNPHNPANQRITMSTDCGGHNMPRHLLLSQYNQISSFACRLKKKQIRIIIQSYQLSKAFNMKSWNRLLTQSTTYPANTH